MISLKKLAADGLIKLTDARRKYTIDGVQRLEAIYRIPLNTFITTIKMGELVQLFKNTLVGIQRWS